jgi:hypothetical protein
MESVNVSNRPFNVRQQSHANLTGEPTYYRLHLSSLHRVAGDNVSDATFDVGNVFPMSQRQDLLDGTWEVFLEEWVCYFASSISTNTGQHGLYPRYSMKLCLPDLIHSPQDFTTNGVGKAMRDDTVAHVPLDYQFRQPLKIIPPAYKDIIYTQASNTTAANGQVTLTTTANMRVGMPIQFRGNTFGSLSTTAVYFIATIPDGTHLTLSTNVHFTNPVTVTDDAGALAVTAGIAGHANELQTSVIIHDELTHVDTHRRYTIDCDSVGRKVDPHQLMKGKIRVLLRDREHRIIFCTTNPPATNGSLTNATNERWQATLLFVHKPKKYS